MSTFKYNWTKKIDDYIRNMYKFKTSSYIAKRFNIHPSAIRYRIRYLKVPYKGQIKDISGKIFKNRIKVLKYIGKDKTHTTLWKCQCFCGNKFITRKSALKILKSCGCLNRTTEESLQRMAFSVQKRSARYEGRTWNIKFKEYINVVRKPCVYCGQMSKRCSGKNFKYKIEIPLNSLDRINNENCYRLYNVQSVCFICQRMKSNIKDKKFRKHIKTIAGRIK